MVAWDNPEIIWYTDTEEGIYCQNLEVTIYGLRLGSVVGIMHCGKGNDV